VHGAGGAAARWRGCRASASTTGLFGVSSVAADGSESPVAGAVPGRRVQPYTPPPPPRAMPRHCERSEAIQARGDGLLRRCAPRMTVGGRMAKKTKQGELPTREQILEFIQTADQAAGKREIAKAFGLKGEDKIALKRLLKDMGDEGLIDAGPGRAFHKMGGVPKVTVLRVVDIDEAAAPRRCRSAGTGRASRRACASWSAGAEAPRAGHRRPHPQRTEEQAPAGSRTR
jgi:hypothetical protein